jgi:serine/threonine-protein kinase
VTKQDDLGAAATVASTPTGASLPSSIDPGGQLPSVLAGRYEIQTLLGAGGMGRVYRAFDRSLDDVVALKVMRRDLVGTPGALTRFRQEVKLARRVTNVHVVRTYDLGEHDGDFFLTMEYLDGSSLARVLENGQPPLDEVMRIARGICAGIAAAHVAGVLHRDLKPDNVLVAKDGRIAITDFGIALTHAEGTHPVERLVGTPAYMAPEQVEGTGEIGPPADVYAFGAMLFEMVTGRRPFPGNDIMAVALARLEQPPPDPRSVRTTPDSLAELVLRCLARQPAARFRDGRAVEQALGGIVIEPSASRASPVPSVPAKTSLAIAVFPLHGDGELADLAEGLTEEVVDALSMTRALRVRPLALVRAELAPHRDPREIGRALGVDVVVMGSVNRSSDLLRIAARAISVGDGFQLWANRFESAPDRLLTASDDIARSVAAALTVEIELPQRERSDPRATELYLQAKSKMRVGWISGDIPDALTDLEAALALSPDDPNILAAYALALARAAFVGRSDSLGRARQVAERAVSLGPSSGETWLALGIAALYANDVGEGTRAMVRATKLAPGLAMAQAAIGSIVLEAGLLEGAILHLEGAFAIDPSGSQGPDLARAYVYAGRPAEAEAVLAKCVGAAHFIKTMIGRYRMWRHETYEAKFAASDQIPYNFERWAELVFRVYRTGVLGPDDVATMRDILVVENPRMRASRAQIMCELAIFGGMPAVAMEFVAISVDAGMADHLWFERCPLLEPLRTDPKFRALGARAAARARVIEDAVRSG